MTLIAQHLQEDKIEELKDIFKGIDKNDDGAQRRENGHQCCPVGTDREDPRDYEGSESHHRRELRTSSLCAKALHGAARPGTLTYAEIKEGLAFLNGIPRT